MIILNGKYANAKVFNDLVEDTAMSQIQGLISSPVSQYSKVRIMPDVHAGAGCVIGYTATLTDKTIPNLVGVDIGCGVLAAKLENDAKFSYETLDNTIRYHIPSSRAKCLFYI